MQPFELSSFQLAFAPYFCYHIGMHTKIAEPNNALPEISLADLPARLQHAAANAGWPSLMPVQAKAIPYVLAGRDLMIQSRTGSGKTGAFILPIIERIDCTRPVTQALVLGPTRELALQVARDAQTLGHDSGVRAATLYGGVGYGTQMDALKAGAHLVIGTPGRILDHLLRRTLSLEHLRVLIFDEADRMLSMGFYPDMRRLQRYLPKRLSTFMFSATFPPFVMRLSHEFMHQPELLSLSRDHVHVTEVDHAYYVVPEMQRDRCLVRIIELENPASAIIFCNTKAAVHYVTIVLQRFGYDADELSADLSQAAREKVLSRLRTGSLRFLVATDVAARGLDVPELSHVIQYELCDDPEAYIHRAGRTGRAGASGQAFTLVNEMQEGTLQGIGRQFKIDFQKRSVPSDADIEAVVSQRVTALLEARLRSYDRVQVERMQRFLPVARALAQNEEESAVIAMLLDEYYAQTLHGKQVPAPEESQEPAPAHHAGGEDRPPRRRSGRRS